jgi:futalosine hydrolase
MNCLIVAATPIEISPLLKELKAGKFNKKNLEIDVLITGIGLISTTYALSKQFCIKRPDLVIQAGVAGCFDSSLKLGTVVAIKKEAIADQSVIELGQLKTMFDLKLVPANQYPFKKGWIENKHPLLKKIKLKKVAAISVNEITTDKKKVHFYQSHFNPVMESMEGAALHYVCSMEKIPYLQLRSSSNYIAERKKSNWNLKDSVINLNNELFTILAML